MDCDARAVASADSSSAIRLAALTCATAVLLLLKLGVLAAFGPNVVPDTASYVAYADAILSGAFAHVDLQHDLMPVVLIRPIGYPAVIAAAKFVAGPYWGWAVILLQAACSMLATAMTYRLARAFGLGMWVALAVAAAQATSMQFVVDQSLASDSLCGSAMTITTCWLGETILRGATRPLFLYLGAGTLIVVAFLMRNVIEFLTVGYVPLAVAAALVEPSRVRRLSAFALVFVPLVAAHIVYTQWNRERAGVAVVATIGQATLIEALVEASRYDPAILSGDTPIDAAAREVLPTRRPDWPAYPQITDVLMRNHGWNAVTTSHETMSEYLAAWKRYPVAMIRHLAMHFSETQLHQAVRPTETVRDILLWNTGSDHDFARESAVAAGNWWMIPAVIAHPLAETLSVAVFAAFLLVTPLRPWRDGWTAQTQAAVGLWFAYFVFVFAYAAVHLEPRFLTPVVAGSIVVGVADIAWLVACWRRAAPAPGLALAAKMQRSP